MRPNDRFGFNILELYSVPKKGIVASYGFI